MEHQNQYPHQQHPTQPQGTNPNFNTQTVIVNAGPAQKMKNKWVALLLCFFFGFLGAHKFYEEKTGLGIVYLLTCGLFCIGTIIDFIALLFKPSQYSV